MYLDKPNLLWIQGPLSALLFAGNGKFLPIISKRLLVMYSTWGMIHRWRKSRNSPLYAYLVSTRLSYATPSPSLYMYKCVRFTTARGEHLAPSSSNNWSSLLGGRGGGGGKEERKVHFRYLHRSMVLCYEFARFHGHGFYLGIEAACEY